MRCLPPVSTIFVDNLSRSPCSKAVVAADAHALFDLERPAGSHDLLPFLKAGQHQGPRGIDASRNLTHETLNKRGFRDLFEYAGPRHAPSTTCRLGEGVWRALRHSYDRSHQRR